MISEKIPSQSLPLGSLGHGPQESPETNPNGEIVVPQVHNHTRPVSSSTKPSWMWKYSVFFKNINNYQSLLSNQPHLQSNLITISKILTNRKKKPSKLPSPPTKKEIITGLGAVLDCAALSTTASVAERCMAYWPGPGSDRTEDTLLETKMSPTTVVGKMIFLFQRWDMLVSRRVNQNLPPFRGIPCCETQICPIWESQNLKSISAKCLYIYICVYSMYMYVYAWCVWIAFASRLCSFQPSSPPN